jgi:hypothetical protein
MHFGLDCGLNRIQASIQQVVNQSLKAKLYYSDSFDISQCCFEERPNPPQDGVASDLMGIKATFIQKF